MALLAAVAGCWTDYYDARMKKRLPELRKTGDFHKYLIAEAAPDPINGISIRLPMLFQGKEYSEVGKGRVEMAAWVQAPEIPLPGFKYSLMAETQTNKTESMFVYFYVVDAKSQKSEADFLKELLDIVKKKLPATQEWTDVSLTGEDGSSKPYKYLKATGPQKFYTGPGANDTLDYAGRFDLYVTKNEANYLVVGWRTTDTVAAKNNFFDAAKSAMGTVKFTVPKPAETPPADKPAEKK
jgi:hypothetical protein